MFSLIFRIADVTDGAVERVIPVIDLASDEKDKLNKNKIEERETVVVNKPIEKNGHYYLKVGFDLLNEQVIYWEFHLKLATEINMY